MGFPAIIHKRAASPASQHVRVLAMVTARKIGASHLTTADHPVIYMPIIV